MSISYARNQDGPAVKLFIVFQSRVEKIAKELNEDMSFFK